MKRSEMLDQMVCDLLIYSATYPQYPLDQLLLAAEEILKTQEKLGMLPPKTETYIKIDEKNNQLVYRNMWDKE